MNTLKLEAVSTALEVKEAIKEGYKFAFQMQDPATIYVSEDISEADKKQAYEDCGYAYNEFADVSEEKHIGCPIEEAIDLFGLA